MKTIIIFLFLMKMLIDLITFKKDISNFENEENNNHINNNNNNNIPNLQNLIEQNENYKAKIADIKDSLL